MTTARRRRLNTDSPTARSTPTTDSPTTWQGPAAAAPRVEMWARSMADAAYELHDIARAGGWNEGAAEDAIAAFEMNAQALETVHPDAGEVLAVARRVAAELRRLLHLPPPDVDSHEQRTRPPVSPPREEPGRRPPAPDGQPHRRGLGPGWQGIPEA